MTPRSHLVAVLPVDLRISLVNTSRRAVAGHPISARSPLWAATATLLAGHLLRKLGEPLNEALGTAKQHFYDGLEGVEALLSSS
jgi:hypothetical protein